MEPTNFCPQCGQQVRAGALFCSKCGTDLAPLEPAPEASPSVQDEVAHLEPATSHWSRRTVLATVAAVFLFGVGGYLGARFLARGVNSPSGTVHAMILAV